MGGVFMRRFAYLLIGMFAVAVAFVAPSLAADKVGIVLLHGKGGTALPKSPIGKLAAVLKKAGFLVVTPDMPWSKSRDLAKDYDESMAEIDAAVAQLKKKGATKIVVAGVSMGANAAVGYGARRDGLAGVMALSPGHVPDDPGYQNSIDNDWRRAKSMVDDGKGDTVGSFNDNDQGKKFKVKAKARVYLSWFDPAGEATYPKNAAAIKPGTPLLWVVGNKDIMLKRGESYAFALAPHNDKSAYVVVDGGHMDSPMKASGQIIDWLNSL
jgi:pimeloyl-ACP methyl ester carboxylesterase